MRNVRIWFSKTGNIRYVSHLDMFRLMTRAVRRADIPLWYTEGFNPHPYISFLQPLSLGVETLYDPLDIRIEGTITNIEIRERLNAVLPAGMRIEAVTEPFCKPADIAWGTYRLLLDKEDISAEEVKALIANGGLTCEKSAKVGGKKGVKTVDVSASLKKYAVKETEDGILIGLVLPASSDLTVNPLQFLSALCNKCGRSFQPLRAVRLRLLCKDGSHFS